MVREASTPEYLQRAATLEGFGNLCAELGLGADSLLRQAGLERALLQDPETLIPRRAFLQVLDLAARASGLPHFGLLLADKQSFSMLGPLGFLAVEAPNVRQLITQLNAYIHLHNQSLAGHLDVTGEIATWSYETLDADVRGQVQSEDHIIATGLGLLRQYIGNDWNPYYISIQHGTPGDIGPYRRKFRCPIEFSAERSQVAFDARLLDQRTPHGDSRLYAILDTYIKHLDASVSMELDRRIQLVILQAMKRGDCSLRRVAANLAITPRSLQRRLADAGTSFQAEVDAVRNGVARHYLKATQMPLTVIAELLAYSDLASFSRAFKRMNGRPPQAWRQDALSERSRG